MGENVDSDLLYDDFQDNDRKEFDNVNNSFKLNFNKFSVNFNSVLIFV